MKKFLNLIVLFKFFVLGIFSALLFPPFFIFPIGFVIFPTIFFLLNEKNYIKKSKLFQFFSGIIYGLGLSLLILNWIKEPFLLDDSSKNIYFISYLLVLYCSIYYGISFYLLSFIKNKISKLILIPLLFVICEILREFVGFGFPWITFALVNSGNSILLNLLYFFGTYGVSYITILIFLIPASIVLFLNKDNNNFILKFYIFFSTILIVLCTFLIFIRYNFNEDFNKKELSVTLAQMNFIQTSKMNNVLAEKRIKEIQETIYNSKSELLIFAENNYPFLLEDLSDLESVFNNLDDNQSIIIGATKKINSQFFNTLILFEKNKIQYFNKIILVPFGEFLPFRNLLNFLDTIVGGDDYSSGIKARLIESSNDLKIIPIICYEIIFFNNLLNSNNNDGDILINITNDSWFGYFSGPYQHFYLSRMRASEFNKPLIRVSNNGVSAIFDNYGKIIDFIPLNKKNIKHSELIFTSNLLNLTSYHFLIFPFLMILFVLALAINKIKNE